MFSLDHWTMAKVTHVNKRTENHGDAPVHVVDLSWKIEGPNTILDGIHPSLRATLYRAAKSQTLPTVIETTPELASEHLVGPHDIRFEGTGYMLTIKHGLVSGEQIELAGSEVHKMKVDAKQGGTVVLTFQSRHVGLTNPLLGVVVELDARDVELLLAPPALQEGTGKGKKGKKADEKKDTQTAELPLGDPAPADGGSAPLDATEAFLAAEAKRDAAKRAAEPAAAKKVAAKKKPAVTPAAKKAAAKAMAAAKKKAGKK